MLPKRIRRGSAPKVMSIGDLFEALLQGFESENEASRRIAMPLDVFEKDKEIVVQAELPGFERDKIEVRFEQDVLTISAQRQREKEDKPSGDAKELLERLDGTFERSIRLPVDVDPDKIKAAYNDGVLTVTLPKSEKAGTQQIRIE